MCELMHNAYNVRSKAQLTEVEEKKKHYLLFNQKKQKARKYSLKRDDDKETH